MKKYWKSNRWKRHQRRVRAKALRRKARKAKQRNARVRVTSRAPVLVGGGTGVHLPTRPARKTPSGPFRRGRDSVRCPATLSLVEQPEEALEFFKKLDDLARRRKSIFVDLETVTRLTPDAILYTVSRLAHYTRQGVHLHGNAPQDVECRDLWIHSGFYDHVAFAGIATPQNSDMLAIRHGIQASSNVAGEVVEFAAAHLGLDVVDDLGPAYVALVECMTNTFHHAAKKSTRPVSWSLIARRNKATGKVQFAILDTGQGIPATVRRVGLFEQTIGRAFGDDHKLILSTLEAGVLRTRSGKKHRGRGLPKIFEFAQQGKIQDLRILSRCGFVHCQGEKQEGRELQDRLRFMGTLLAWDFAKTEAA